MNLKALAIVGVAGALMLSAGVISGCGNHDTDSDATDAPTAPVVVSESVTEAPGDADETLPTEIETQQPTAVEDNDPNGYSDILASSGTYRVRRVYDHASSGEVTAREVFGQLYSYCSLSFDSDGSFELCINPTSGEIRRGSFAVYGDDISVEYDDGKGSEFRIINDAPGEIDYILVNYGDYDVYFGLN